MPDYKAKGSLTVEGTDGSSITFGFIASRVGSYAELGTKIGAAVQTQVDQMAAEYVKKVADLERALEESEKALEASRVKLSNATAPVVVAPPVEDKPLRKAKRSDS